MSDKLTKALEWAHENECHEAKVLAAEVRRLQSANADLLSQLEAVAGETVGMAKKLEAMKKSRQYWQQKYSWSKMVGLAKALSLSKGA